MKIKRKRKNITNYYNFSEQTLTKLFKKSKYSKIIKWVSDKSEVRNTKEWLELKCYIANKQNMLDYITNQPLNSRATLHHLDLHEKNYGKLNSDKFVMLNPYSHKFLHWASQQCHKIGKKKFLKNLIELIDIMENLNKDIPTFPLARG